MILRLKDESCDVIRVLKWTSGSSDAHFAPRITNACHERRMQMDFTLFESLEEHDIFSYRCECGWR